MENVIFVYFSQFLLSINYQQIVQPVSLVCLVCQYCPLLQGDKFFRFHPQSIVCKVVRFLCFRVMMSSTIFHYRLLIVYLNIIIVQWNTQRTLFTLCPRFFSHSSGLSLPKKFVKLDTLCIKNALKLQI